MERRRTLIVTKLWLSDSVLAMPIPAELSSRFRSQVMGLGVGTALSPRRVDALVVC